MSSRLQHELKKKRPFTSVAEAALLNVLRTADRLDHRTAQLFREHGLTGPQYNILRILRGAGEPLPILEIGSRMLTVVPAITGLIDRLEQAGLVERRRSAEDRRVIYVAATERALELLARLDAPLAALQRDLTKPLTKHELAELNRLLDKLRSTIDGVG
jgi:DNA-binding MarR family transcriptional regulator